MNAPKEISYYSDGSGAIYCEFYDTYCIWYRRSGEIESKLYFRDFKQHRIDGPASIDYYKSGKIKREEYLINDKLHRIDGPARISYYPSGEIQFEEYWINDRKINIEYFLKEIGIKELNKEAQILLGLKYG